MRRSAVFFVVAVFFALPAAVQGKLAPCPDTAVSVMQLCRACQIACFVRLGNNATGSVVVVVAASV